MIRLLKTFARFLAEVWFGQSLADRCHIQWNFNGVKESFSFVFRIVQIVDEEESAITFAHIFKYVRVLLVTLDVVKYHSGTRANFRIHLQHLFD